MPTSAYSSVLPPIKLKTYAAGNVFDRYPVTLITVPWIFDRNKLAAKLDAAWNEACHRILPHRRDKVSEPGVVDLADATTAAMVIAEVARGLRRICGLHEGRIFDLRKQTVGSVAGLASSEHFADQAALRAAAFLLCEDELPREVESNLAALRYEAWLRKGVWASSVATRLDIPWRIAAPTQSPFVVIGHGRNQCLFRGHLSGRSGHHGSTLASDKRYSSEMLRRSGLPAPYQREVMDAADAVSAADTLGWPVVVKPAIGFGGVGVTAGIRDRNALLEAFTIAKPHGSVVVEKHIEGDHHRITVVRGRFISALRFEAAHVVGDGQSTVLELLNAANAIRAETLRLGWLKIKLDDSAHAMLRRQGFMLDQVPNVGQRVVLRSQSNLSLGGTYSDVTGMLHPDMQRVAEAASRLFDFDICSIDFITPDPSRSWIEVGGGIIEVKRPSVLLGRDRAYWGNVIIGELFPMPARGRIPAAVVLSQSPAAGSIDLIKAVCALLHDNDSEVAIASTEAIRFGPICSGGPASLPRQVEVALADRQAAALVVAARPDEIKATGLGLDRCSLALLTEGIAKDVVVAMLRISTAVVMPAPVFASLANDPILADLVHRVMVWVVGGKSRETPLVESGELVGFVHKSEGDHSIEICPRLGAPWRISDVPTSDDAIILAAAGAALGLHPDRIVDMLLATQVGRQARYSQNLLPR